MRRETSHSTAKEHARAFEAQGFKDHGLSREEIDAALDGTPEPSWASRPDRFHPVLGQDLDEDTDF
ncbi:MAG: hypothetical protein ACI361_07520 [Atopobiaceae bacterium]